MIKVLFIANFNEVASSLNDYLEIYFNVQLCSPNVEIMKSMVKISKPEIIIISLAGMGEKEATLFTELMINHSEIPVINIGTEEELSQFSEFTMEGQFANLLRPVRNSLLIETISRVLNINPIDITNPAKNDTKDPRKHLLFVDDNAMLLRNMRRLFDDKYRVSVATSGIQAVTMMGADRPDIVFLDYEMPGYNGKQIFEMMKSETVLKDIPVVFLTGVDERKYIEEVLELGPEGYLLKPPSPKRISEQIQKILGK